MGLNKDEEALRVADEIFKQILMFRQYGAPAGISPKNAQKKLDVMVEHFVRRDDPESAYYETLGDHSNEESCVCGEWSIPKDSLVRWDELNDIVHGSSERPCYAIERWQPSDIYVSMCGCGTPVADDIHHRLDGLCYFIDDMFEDDPSLKALGHEFKEN